MNNKTDACFYVTDSNEPELVVMANERYSINRAGVMVVILDNTYVMHTTKDLADVGINTDEDLIKFESRLEWRLNPWFEIWDSYEEEWVGEPYHTTLEAIDAIKIMNGDNDTE